MVYIFILLHSEEKKGDFSFLVLKVISQHRFILVISSYEAVKKKKKKLGFLNNKNIEQQQHYQT